jgi:hypothetical protein
MPFSMKLLLRKGGAGAQKSAGSDHNRTGFCVWCTGEEDSFDSTVERGSPDRQQLGQGQLLPGLEILLASMYPGQIACGLLGRPTSDSTCNTVAGTDTGGLRTAR